MTGLCAYRNIFGAPGTGAHAYRLGGIAVVDMAMTLAAAAVTAWAMSYSFLVVSIVFLLIGIVAHRLFCVNTALNVMILGEVEEPAAEEKKSGPVPAQPKNAGDTK